jgi:ribonuclease BN (tRNA processing enzyme)
MKLRFNGVRGFVPTPGVGYLRYGGNTPCTAVWGADDELVILDAGTGFCLFADTLLTGAFGRGQGEMVLLMSSTYWDHILGLPFPAVVHLPGNRLTVYGPSSTRGSLEMVYDGMLSPAYSPVYGLANIGATHTFREISSEPFTVGKLTIRALPVTTNGTSAAIWAYRIEEETRSLVYMTHVRSAEETIFQQAVAFTRDADLLIHSAPYTLAEDVQDYGHSRVEDALELAVQAKVHQLLLFHHAPTRTDDQLDALLDHYRDDLAQRGTSLRLNAACEGLVLAIGE